MLCQLICIGKMSGEPKRLYSKKNIECSSFNLLIKRSDNGNNWDLFRFFAWGRKANFVNEYLHDGDIVSIVSRPRPAKFKKKDGTKVETISNYVLEIQFICHRNKILLNKFDGIDFPEMPDINYDLF